MVGISSDERGASANLHRCLPGRGLISTVTWRQVFNRNDTRFDLQIALRERDFDAVFLKLSRSPRDQLIEQAFFFHQVTIGSHFSDFAGFQDTDFIVVFDDIQSVDHRNQGSSAL